MGECDEENKKSSISFQYWLRIQNGPLERAMENTNVSQAHTCFAEQLYVWDRNNLIDAH